MSSWNPIRGPHDHLETGSAPHPADRFGATPQRVSDRWSP